MRAGDEEDRLSLSNCFGIPHSTLPWGQPIIGWLLRKVDGGRHFPMSKEVPILRSHASKPLQVHVSRSEQHGSGEEKDVRT